MSAGRRRVAPEDRPGWAHHVITIGVAIAAAVIVILCAAGVGLFLAQSSAPSGAVPGRGVTPMPTPVWVRPS
jgi:hypothetical protein